MANPTFTQNSKLPPAPLPTAEGVRARELPSAKSEFDSRLQSEAESPQQKYPSP